VHFTREPIIETVLTPREGFRLVVRSSKNPSAQEYWTDSVQVVSFGQALFYRCIEKPHHFLVPVSDYEVLELRETRVSLKHPGGEKTERPKPPAREREQRQQRKQKPTRARAPEPTEEGPEQEEAPPIHYDEAHLAQEGEEDIPPVMEADEEEEGPAESGAPDRKKRRRRRRGRGGREGGPNGDESAPQQNDAPAPSTPAAPAEPREPRERPMPPPLIPPPATLVHVPRPIEAPPPAIVPSSDDPMAFLFFGQIFTISIGY
jgi:hypothetical protein